MKLIFWNVNGLENRIAQDFLTQFDTFDADFFCIRQTGFDGDPALLDLPGYQQFWCPEGAIFTKHEPVRAEINGNSILLEYPEFYLINGTFDRSIPDFQRPVILCGDVSSHLTDPLKPFPQNTGAAGFWVSPELAGQVYRANLHTTVELPCPVSIDIDLPCNGSILSPTSQGKARLVSQEKTEEPDAEETAAPVKTGRPKARILAVSAVLILLLCAALLWPNAPTEENEPPLTIPTNLVPIRIVEHENIPICYDYLSISCLPPVNAMGSTMLLVSSLINDVNAPNSKPLVYTDPFLVSDLNQATFCIQVELTEDALKLAKDGWEFYATPEHIFNSKPYAQIDHFNVIPYYKDESRSQIAGWFIFGLMKSEGTISISVSHDDSNFTYREYPVVVPSYDVTMPDVVADATILENPPTDENGNIFYGFESEGLTDMSLTISGTPYKMGVIHSVAPKNGDCWVLLQPNEVLLSELGFGNLNVDIQPYNASCQLIWLYKDDFGFDPYAYLLVIDSSTVSNMMITMEWLSDGETYSDTISFDVFPIVTADHAPSMTTEQLIQAILRNPTLCESLSNRLSTNTPALPVLQELLTRPDAIDVLMNCDISRYDESVQKVPRTILRLDEFTALMTPSQWARYVLLDYPSSNSERALFLPESDSTLEGYVFKLAVLNSPVSEFIDTEEEWQGFFEYLQEECPEFSELIAQEDAYSFCIAYVNDDKIGPFFTALAQYLNSYSAADTDAV